MRKKIRMVIFVMVMLLLSSCGNSKPTTVTTTGTSAPQVVATSESTESVIQAESNSESDTESEKSDQVDVDLTQLSSTMIYSEVYNMMVTPEDYVGKTIKMSGQFVAYEGNPQNADGPAYYFAVVIADATACCSQGLEFVWSGEHDYPDDYPEQGTEVTVTGVFETYQESGYTYCHLIADNIVDKNEKSEYDNGKEIDYK